MSADTLTTTRPWIFAAYRVAEIRDLTPTFRQFALAPSGEHRLTDPGFDQRIKVVPPGPVSLDAMPTGTEWYAEWRAMPDGSRPPFRTYTIRGFEDENLVVDFALHGPEGPASRWAIDASIGDELLILGPNAASEGPFGGADFLAPARTDHHLLVGDETAAPAIARIVEQLPPEATGTVVVELPTAADFGYLPTHPGFTIRLLCRDDRIRGEALVQTVAEVTAELIEGGAGEEPEPIDVDGGILWEVPRGAKGGAALQSAPLYAWLAGESGTITTIRRHLVKTLGIDRRAVAFMGYWREGRAEPN